MTHASDSVIGGLLKRKLELEQPSNMEATSQLKIVTEDDANEIIKMKKKHGHKNKIRHDLFKAWLATQAEHRPIELTAR